MELVRLAIPRRVYTESHLRYVAESVIELYGQREKLRGMRIVANGESPCAISSPGLNLFNE
jgi:tryptophanase